MWSNSGPQFWVPYLDPKMGSAIGEFRCCPQMLCRFATLQLEHEFQHIPFCLCASQVRLLLSRSLYRSHVLTTFLGPVLGAMMKQVCWHSRRIRAHRGLPEARGQSEAHGDSNLYTRRPQIQTFCTQSTRPHVGSQQQLPLPAPPGSRLCNGVERQVFTARHCYQPWFRGVQGGGSTCGRASQARVMFVYENYQRRCQSLYWLDRNTSMLRCETTKDNVTTLYWLCRKTTCFRVKTTKGDFKLCIGLVAKLLRTCSMDKERNIFFYFFSIGRNP